METEPKHFGLEKVILIPVFFHASTTCWKKCNKIEKIENEIGDVVNDPAHVRNVARDYFQDLSQSRQGKYEPVISCMEPCITLEDNEELIRPFTRKEFSMVLKQMDADKAPGPDGFNPGFFKHLWVNYGDAFFQAGCRWLEDGSFPPTLNETNIALIPKIDSPESRKDWRPISLCNVLYKVISKVLANRLKYCLHKCFPMFSLHSFLDDLFWIML